MFKYIMPVFIILLISNLRGQEYKWAVSACGFHDHNFGYDVHVDNLNNVYYTGEYSDSTDFDAGPGVLMLPVYGSIDIYLVKRRNNGILIWATGLGGKFHDSGNRVTSDDSGNVYIEGIFSDTVDFDPGPAVFNQIGGYPSTFFAKYDSIGQFMWVKTIHSPPSVTDMKLDAKGNIYLTGTIQTATDFDPSPVNAHILSPNPNSHDGFIAKYKNDGTFLWARAISGQNPGSCEILENALGESGDVYITGYFEGSVDYDPGSGSVVKLSSGNNDIFIAKYDSSGNFLWVRSIGGASYDKSLTIALDGDENVYFAGKFTGIVDFDAGSNSFSLNFNSGSDFLSSYNRLGDFRWAVNFTDDNWTNSRVNKIKVDNEKNIYLTGNFSGTADFDPGINASYLTSTAGENVFFVKYDSIGNFIWARKPEGLGASRGYSVDVDDSGNAYFTGIFTGNWIDFNFGLGTDFHFAPHTGSFVAKYGSCSALNGTDSAIICLGEYFHFPSGDSATVSTVDTSTILSYYGCDSSVITHLTVEAADASVQQAGKKLTAQANNASYQWLQCDGIGYVMLNGETKIEFTATANGKYALAVMQNGCTDTSECIEINSVGLIEISKNGISVYPNPTRGRVQIKYTDMSSSTIRVYNILGNAIPASMSKIDARRIEVDLGEIPAGLYFLDFRSENNSTVFKLLKE